MLISVVIPTCDRNDLLAKCLDRLAPAVQINMSLDRADSSDVGDAHAINAAHPQSSYEVIVSDDGSQTTAEGLVRERYPWVRWVRGPKRGPSANRNNGAKQARGEWLAFLDDDCVPDPGWLGAYAKAVYDTFECQVLEGRTYSDREKRSLAEIAPINENGGYLWSCNFAISRAGFIEMLGFDESYPYAAMEDVDFRERLKKRGRSIQFVRDASVCHPWRHAGGWGKLRQYEYSVGVYLARHPEKVSELDGRFYFRIALRGLLKETLPGVFRYRGAGALNSVMRHLFYLKMAWQVSRRSSQALALPNSA